MSIKRRRETACMITARTDPNFNDTELCQNVRIQTPAERDMRRKDHTDTTFTCEFT